MDFGAFTDIGRIRSKNEDSFYVPEKDDKTMIFLVSDGIGGHRYGEKASEMTIKNIVECIKKNNDKFTGKEELLRDAVIYTNKKIYDFSNEHREYKGMGATLVAVILEEGKMRVTHAGDSRCYIIRNSIISQLTVDNSYVEYLLQKGAITAEEAKNHPQKNFITKAIGMEENIDVDDIEEVITKPNDIFLLCSDGLTSMLSDEDILHIILKKNGNMQSTAKELTEEANKRGGNDNITVILLEV